MKNYIKQVSILYVEDEEVIREGYRRTIKRLTDNLFVAKNGLEGLELYKKYHPDIVISDIKMPGMNGIEMAKEIKAINKDQIVIFTTAYTESNYTIEALALQAEAYLLKPVDKSKLKAKLNYLAKNIINERENIKNQKILQSVLDNQSSISILTDFEKIEFASNSFYKLMDVSDRDSFYDKYNDFLSIFVLCKEHIYAKTKEEFLSKYNNAPSQEKIVSIKSSKGDKSFFISIDKVSEVQKRDIFVLSLIDITYLEEEKIRAQYRASHDALTKVYNREKFNELFEMEFQRARRYDRPMSLAILDIDHFKNVNDNYGHLVGDEVLKELSSFCEQNIRQTDIFARWGGEEFMLLMGETDMDTAFKVCEQLRESVEMMDKRDIPKITISIGVTAFSKNDTVESLLKMADEALYEAKNSGRNKVVLKGA